MHYKGATDEYIASVLGRSPITVNRHIRAHKVDHLPINDQIDFGAKEIPYYQSEEEQFKHSKIR